MGADIDWATYKLLVHRHRRDACHVKTLQRLSITRCLSLYREIKHIRSHLQPKQHSLKITQLYTLMTETKVILYLIQSPILKTRTVNRTQRRTPISSNVSYILLKDDTFKHGPANFILRYPISIPESLILCSNVGFCGSFPTSLSISVISCPITMT
jgi:hypothetical protein